MAKLLLALAVPEPAGGCGRGRSAAHDRQALSLTAGAASDAPALDLLGLDADASEPTSAPRTAACCSAVHPDHGGTAELAQRINAARDAVKLQD